MKENYDFTNSWSYKKVAESHLYITVDEEKLAIQLVKMRLFGRVFYKGERNFISSDGFIITSANHRVYMHPRIGKLILPDAHRWDYDRGYDKLAECPHNRTYFEYMIKAIDEYNEEIRKC